MTEGQKSHDDTRGPGLHLLSTCVPGAERAAVITANGIGRAALSSRLRKGGVAKSEAQSSLAGQDHQLSSKMEMQIKDLEASLCRLERLGDGDGGTVFTPCPTAPHPPGFNRTTQELARDQKGHCGPYLLVRLAPQYAACPNRDCHTEDVGYCSCLQSHSTCR